jgi:hypothetical protein
VRDDRQPLAAPAHELRGAADDGERCVVESVGVLQVEDDERPVRPGDRDERVAEGAGDALVQWAMRGDHELSPRELGSVDPPIEVEHAQIVPTASSIRATGSVKVP